jgi:hypothetical protein
MRAGHVAQRETEADQVVAIGVYRCQELAVDFSAAIHADSFRIRVRVRVQVRRSDATAILP